MNKHLQKSALDKLARMNNNPLYEQIRRVATKETELTNKDVAQLEHFLATKSTELQNTTYFGNTIVDPNNWDKHRHTKLATGKWRTQRVKILHSDK